MLDVYVRDEPSAQAAVDIFAGEWASGFPTEVQVEAGGLRLFDDPRVSWVIDQVGDLKGHRVLELGPLEGAHTCQLTSVGAHVTGIESNTRAYLRCLVYKELVGMANAKFLLGDFTRYLETRRHDRYDFVLASGVLYHQTDPCHLLELIAAVTDRLAIWTHYYDGQLVAALPHLARYFEGAPLTAEFRGHGVSLHRRDYLEVANDPRFCGGPLDHANWMELDDIVNVLGLLGFSDVRFGPDDSDHPNGPACLLYAHRA